MWSASDHLNLGVFDPQALCASRSDFEMKSWMMELRVFLVSSCLGGEFLFHDLWRVFAVFGGQDFR